MRNVLLIATAGCALTTASAFAADLPTKKAPPLPVVVAPFTWTGCYVGAEGGFGWGKEKDDFDYPLYYLPELKGVNTSVITQSVPEVPLVGASVGGGGFNVSGGKIGGRAGCNYQMNQLVIGGVVDFEWSGINGTKSSTWTDKVTTYSNTNYEGVTVNEPGYAHLKLQNNWQGSIRANLGWAFDRLLIYATGGAAFAEIKSTWSVNDPCAGADNLGTNPYSCAFYTGTTAVSSINPFFNPGWIGGSQTKTVWGWTLGGGVEYAIDNHWSLLGEVRYASFQKENFTVPITFYQYSNGEYGRFGYNAGFNEVLAQVGIDYRF